MAAAYISVLVCVRPSTGCAASLLRHSSDDAEPDAADTKGFHFCRISEHHGAVQEGAERMEDRDWNKYIYLNLKKKKLKKTGGFTADYFSLYDQKEQ